MMKDLFAAGRQIRQDVRGGAGGDDGRSTAN